MTTSETGHRMTLTCYNDSHGWARLRRAASITAAAPRVSCPASPARRPGREVPGVPSRRPVRPAGHQLERMRDINDSATPPRRPVAALGGSRHHPTMVHRDHCLSAAAKASNKEIALCVSRALTDRLVIELY